MTRRCFKCLCEKPLDGFYAHPKGKDGRMGKCKECTKADVTANRLANLDRVRAYDKLRGSMPHRVAARRDYANTPDGRIAHQRALKASALRYPERATARYAVSNAIRDGKLQRWPCEVCGEVKSEAHHPHYAAPLLVTWLCNTHHREAHELTEA